MNKTNHVITLNFIVEGETISPDPSCDFNGLFPGKNNEVQAHFEFSPEWGDRIKVAAFYSMLGKEFPPQIIDKENTCMIPQEALMLPTYKLQVFGNFYGKITTTNTLTVYQKGGRA